MYWRKITFRVFTILLTTFVFCSNKGLSQVYELAYISLSAGPSLPLGDYAESDANKMNSGYATFGGLTVFKFGINFKVNYGLVSAFFTNINGTDSEPYKDKITQEHPGYNWDVDSKIKVINGALLGFRTRLLKKNITYHFDILGGVLRSNSSELIATSIIGQEINSVKQHDNTAYAFTYIIGGGISYEISKAFSLMAEINILNSNPRFNDVITTTRIGETTTQSVVSFNQAINIYSLLIGLKYSFMY